jgi:arylsulfatase A-like enzyme
MQAWKSSASEQVAFIAAFSSPQNEARKLRLMTLKNPNVVLVCVDQWRGDCLSVAGHPVVKTPFLDSLANSGTWFSNAYSANPTCTPARMSLITGLRAETHRRVGYADGVPFDVDMTLPQAFRDAGYQTQAIGKMHYSPERVRLGFDDVILHDGYLQASRRRQRDARWYDDYLTWLRKQAGESAASDYIENGTHCNAVTARPWDKAESLHPTNWVVTQAEDWLYRRDPTRPFFLYMSFHRPHAPYDPPEWAFNQYLHGYPDHEPPVGEWIDTYAEYRNDVRPDSLVAEYDQQTMNRARAGYYGHMSHIDMQMNRLFETLGEFGVRDDTVIMFVSDHGDMMGDHNLWRKGYPYEGSAKIPMIIAGPGVQRGCRDDQIVELRDVMPTLLQCAGLDVPSGVEGRSLLATVDVSADSSSAGRDWLHGEHPLFGQSLQWIRTGDWKYVWLSGKGEEQLFNLATDPSETKNLANHGDVEQALLRCRALLVGVLRGRPEGFVADNGSLVAGRPVGPLLPEPFTNGALDAGC